MRGVGTAPRGPAGLALLVPWFCLCGWPLVWASLQLLLQRSGLESNKAIVFIPGECIQARALCTVPSSESRAHELPSVVSRWITEGNPFHRPPLYIFSPIPRDSLKPKSPGPRSGPLLLTDKNIGKKKFLCILFYFIFLLITRKPQTYAELHDLTDHVPCSLLNCG